MLAKLVVSRILANLSGVKANLNMLFGHTSKGEWVENQYPIWFAKMSNASESDIIVRDLSTTFCSFSSWMLIGFLSISSSFEREYIAAQRTAVLPAQTNCCFGTMAIKVNDKWLLSSALLAGARIITQVHYNRLGDKTMLYIRYIYIYINIYLR